MRNTLCIQHDKAITILLPHHNNHTDHKQGNELLQLEMYMLALLITNSFSNHSCMTLIGS